MERENKKLGIQSEQAGPEDGAEAATPNATEEGEAEGTKDDGGATGEDEPEAKRAKTKSIE
jgi:hypothetical protein